MRALASLHNVRVSGALGRNGQLLAVQCLCSRLGCSPPALFTGFELCCRASHAQHGEQASNKPMRPRPARPVHSPLPRRVHHASVNDAACWRIWWGPGGQPTSHQGWWTSSRPWMSQPCKERTGPGTHQRSCGAAAVLSARSRASASGMAAPCCSLSLARSCQRQGGLNRALDVVLSCMGRGPLPHRVPCPG